MAMNRIGYKYRRCLYETPKFTSIYALCSFRSTILSGLPNHLSSSPISYYMVYLHTICVINSLFITGLMELLAHNGVHCLPFLYCCCCVVSHFRELPSSVPLLLAHWERESREGEGKDFLWKGSAHKPCFIQRGRKPVCEVTKVRSVYEIGVGFLHAWRDG